MCGACGMRQFVKPKVTSDQKYFSYIARYMNLKDPNLLLKFSIQQQQEYVMWNEFTIKLLSVLHWCFRNQSFDYIHPEAVDIVEIIGTRVEMVFVCRGLLGLNKEENPKYALA